MRVIELTDDRHGLEAFVVVDHDQFPIAAGGTRMLPDVDVGEVARLARAMTWKFAAWRVPYAGAKAEIALARGKDVGDKRQSIKEREMKREMERAIRR